MKKAKPAGPKAKLPAPKVDEMLQAVDLAITKVRTRQLDVSFNELFDMFQAGELEISPDFQRLFRWPESKQSQFVESILLELPIPPIYVIEEEGGKYVLIDGLQRISSYLHFRGIEPSSKKKDFLTLNECDVLPILNGQRYDTLPQALQIKLKRHFIRMEVLRKESDIRLRYHMFKRLNTGGLLLSPQEVRNCTIRLLDGTFNEYLKTLAATDDYKTCMTMLSEEKQKQMYMEEYVLRFFALRNNRKQYVKEIGDFLTEYMEAVADPDTSGIWFDYEENRKAFEVTFGFLSKALGESAFSGVNSAGTPKGYFSALLFEALTIGLQDHLDVIATATPKVVGQMKVALTELKREKTFQSATKGGGLNYAAALARRIDFVKKKVGSCLGN